MQFEQVRQYVDTVKDSDRFKEMLEFTQLMQLNPEEDLYENIRHYLSLFHARRDCEEWFQPNYEHFIKFLQHYLKGEPAEDVFDEQGYLDLSQTLYLVKPIRFAASAGDSTDNHIMLTDGRKYISKIPLNYQGGSGIRNKYSIFVSLIASYIAKAAETEAAEIALARTYNGKRILSKNFLQPNEELVLCVDDMEETTVSNYLSKLEQALRLRKFPNEEIAKIMFESLKQEFVAKLIGLKDQRADNSPVIIGVDENGKRYARVAPMFDLDYSFHIGEIGPDFITRTCDNGKDDIGSLIEQYKDYPGFEEFVKTSIQSIDMVNIFRQMYEETGIKIFGEYEGDEEMKKFMHFVNKNIRTCKRNY